MRKHKSPAKRFPLPSQSHQDDFQRAFQTTLASRAGKHAQWPADYQTLTDGVGVNPRFLQSHLYHIITATGVERERLAIRRLADQMHTLAGQLSKWADEISDVNRKCLITLFPVETLPDYIAEGAQGAVTRQDAIVAGRLPADLVAYSQLLHRLVPIYRRHANLKGYGSDDYVLTRLDSYIKQLVAQRRHPRVSNRDVAHPYIKEVANLVSAAAETLVIEEEDVTTEPDSLARKIDRFRNDQHNRDVVDKIDRDVAQYIAEGNDGWPIPGRARS